MSKFRQHAAQIQAWQDMQLTRRYERLKADGKIKMPYVPPERPILSKERRKIAVEKVAAALGDFTLTPFEFEASTLHGLRQQFCIGGNDWQRSQNEARIIVDDALKRVGAKRPTWSEGQPQHIASREACACCDKPLEMEQITAGDRFCDEVCAQAFIAKRQVRWDMLDKEVEQSARRTVEIASRPRLKCDHCGKSFRKRGNSKPGEKAFCSVECAGKAKRTMPEAVCANPGCGKTFRIASSDRLETQRYCGHECYKQHRRLAPPVYHGECKLCGTAFERNAPGAVFCSKRCLGRYHSYHSGRVTPKRVTPIVFDYFITLQLAA